MMYNKILNKIWRQASISMLHRNFYKGTILNTKKDYFDIENGKNKLSEAQKLLPKRYRLFDEKDTEIIYDDMVDLDVILNRKQKRPTIFKLMSDVAYLRGKDGVFDIDELVSLLRNENLKDIATIKVPQELKYCDYMVICTAASFRNIKKFVETLNKIYKIKKNGSDKYLNLDDNSNDWRLVDMGNIILHVMLQETRELYDIESLWTVGEQYDDKIQKSEYSIVEDIMSKHIQFLEKQSQNFT